MSHNSKRLHLTAADLQSLTDWKPALIADYIGLLADIDDLEDVADAVEAIQILLDNHIADIDNPHLTSLVSLIDTSIVNPVTGDVLSYNGTTWVNLTLNDIISTCCKDLIIFANENDDQIFSGKAALELGVIDQSDLLTGKSVGIQLKEDLVKLQVSDKKGVQVISEGEPVASVITDTIFFTSQVEQIAWNADGTVMYQVYLSSYIVTTDSRDVLCRTTTVLNPYEISGSPVTTIIETLTQAPVPDTGGLPTSKSAWFSRDGQQMTIWCTDGVFIVLSLVTAYDPTGVISVQNPSDYGNSTVSADIPPTGSVFPAHTTDSDLLVRVDDNSSPSITFYTQSGLSSQSVTAGATYDIYSSIEGDIITGLAFTLDGFRLFVASEIFGGSPNYTDEFALPVAYVLSNLQFLQTRTGEAFAPLQSNLLGTRLYYYRGGTPRIEQKDVATPADLIVISTELYYDDALKLETTNTGVNVLNDITFNTSQTVFPTDYDAHVADVSNPHVVTLHHII